MLKEHQKGIKTISSYQKLQKTQIFKMDSAHASHDERNSFSSYLHIMGGGVPPMKMGLVTKTFLNYPKTVFFIKKIKNS